MLYFFDKIPFLLELFINGTFILVYSLKTTERIPKTWNISLVDQGIAVGMILVPLVICVQLITSYLRSYSLEDFFRRHIFSFVIFIPLLIAWGDHELIFWLSSAHLFSSTLSLYEDPMNLIGNNNMPPKSFNIMNKIRFKPAQLIIISFSSVIALGTFFLMLPIATIDGDLLSFIDALFLSTSATCVTGLTTLSIGGQLSIFGQIIVLVLVQVGGISIMTLYSSMAILLGKSLGVKGRVIMEDLLDISGIEDFVAVIRTIVKYTIVIELFGTVVLTFAFFLEGHEFGQALYYGVFHSISAFCNAGLSLFDTSLESYSTTPLIHGTIAFLITLGGLGFIVLKDLEEVLFQGKKLVKLSIHSKVVLVTSIILTLSGTILFFFGEFLNALESYSLWEKLQIAFFQSVTLRTAGFNTIALSNLNSYTLYLMSLFMFIGGSPGSTAGGVKTTTLAILIQSIRSTLKGKKKVELFQRTISSPVVVKITALTFISIITASFFIFLLMQIEHEQSFLAIFFETISASATVGLSLGVTPYLSTAGKFAILALMYIGRIGPLTLLLAIGQSEVPTGKFDYPKGRIMIG